MNNLRLLLRSWLALVMLLTPQPGPAAPTAASGSAAVGLPKMVGLETLPQPEHPIPVTAVAASPAGDVWAATGHRQIRFLAAGKPAFMRPGYEPVAAKHLLAHWEFEDDGLPTTAGPRGQAFATTADCPDTKLSAALSGRSQPINRYTLATWLFVHERGGVLYGDNSRQIVLKAGRTGCTVSMGRQMPEEQVLGPLPPGRWVHLALTIDRTKVNCFVNGLPAGEAELTGPWAAMLKPGNIGGIFGNAGSRLFGDSAIDDFRWYDRVLTADEIAAIVAEATTPFEIIGGLPFTGGTLHDLRFSRDGRLLVAAGGRGAESGTLNVYDLTTGEVRQMIEGDDDVFLTADLSSDERFVAAGGPTKAVTIHDLGTGKERTRIEKHTDWVTEVAFRPDGKLLASGDRSGGLFVWESETGAIVFTLPGHKAAVTRLVWSADGSRLTSASEDGQLLMWNMKDGFKLQEVAAHQADVLDRWSRYIGVLDAGLLPGRHDGAVFTVGRDRCLRVWGDDEKQRLELCGLAFLPTAAAASRDGRWIMCGDRDGLLHAIDLSSLRAVDVTVTQR